MAPSTKPTSPTAKTTAVERRGRDGAAAVGGTGLRAPKLVSLEVMRLPQVVGCRYLRTLLAERTAGGGHRTGKARRSQHSLVQGHQRGGQDLREGDVGGVIDGQIGP